MAQKTALPPQWVEKLGLEWFWRLLLQPGRAKRIMIAFPLFPLKVFWYKLSS
ncbi:MAG: WecB/TagA/CpsF family glycosyltransferase [Patescibacteria group bacterium]